MRRQSRPGRRMQRLVGRPGALGWEPPAPAPRIAVRGTARTVFVVTPPAQTAALSATSRVSRENALLYPRGPSHPLRIRPVQRRRRPRARRTVCAMARVPVPSTPAGRSAAEAPVARAPRVRSRGRHATVSGPANRRLPSRALRSSARRTGRPVQRRASSTATARDSPAWAGRAARSRTATSVRTPASASRATASTDTVVTSRVEAAVRRAT
jgi:hypothetical protein